jgi:glycosyltransferase involved in cell wall biosynthesis
VAADNGDITAVVACFNYGAYLNEAVESLLDQTGGAPRVVVVDDGSDDPPTLAALDDLPQSVELVRQPNRGVGAARNAGLERADTTYVIVLDADDRLAPGALAAMREALERHPEASFAYGHQLLFGDWNAVLRFPPYDPLRLLDRHLIGPTALTRRELLDDTGGYDAEFGTFEDWELWLHALAHGHRGVRVDAISHEYRRHGQTMIDDARRAYRRSRRLLREKHARLYASRRSLARESSLGLVDRLVYRWYWGPRPLPARVERTLYHALFSRR